MKNTRPNFAPANSHQGGLVMVTFVLLTSGCGELAYKRGANSSDLENAKKTCNAKAPTAPSFEKCMADSGWTLKNLNAMSPLEGDPVIAASIIPGDRRIENTATMTADSQSGHDHVAASPAHEKRKLDMMDTFKISSWWKAGAGAGDLKADTEGCVATLGEPHRPESGTQYATRGLLLCMKEKGWSGLHAK